jgi:UDP-glucose 4-epimerase
VVGALHAAGVELLVLDDLSTGRADRLPAGVRLVRGRVGDRAVLGGVLEGAAGVVHLAALTSAPESVDRPLAYYQANVTDVATLLGAMTEHRVPNLVASSSAAVYGGRPGDPTPAAFPEDHHPRPQNPYGTTKLVGEYLMDEAGGAAGMGTIALRYFNVVGAAARELADRRSGALLPRVLAARRGGAPLVVHGRAHPTPDGSAVRDFVHAADVASAHLAAVSRLASGWRGGAVYNVGTGRGASVLEVLARTSAVTGGPVPWADGPARIGDAACAVADTTRIARELGWHAERDLDAAIASAWAAMTSSSPVTSRRPRLARAG